MRLGDHICCAHIGDSKYVGLEYSYGLQGSRNNESYSDIRTESIPLVETPQYQQQNNVGLEKDVMMNRFSIQQCNDMPFVNYSESFSLRVEYDEKEQYSERCNGNDSDSSFYVEFHSLIESCNHCPSVEKNRIQQDGSSNGRIKESMTRLKPDPIYRLMPYGKCNCFDRVVPYPIAGALV